MDMGKMMVPPSTPLIASLICSLKRSKDQPRRTEGGEPRVLIEIGQVERALDITHCGFSATTAV
jgi:hypothetical protein